MAKACVIGDPFGSQDVSEPLVLGLRRREMREESSQILENLSGQLHRSVRRKHQVALAQAYRKRLPRRGQRHHTSAADRVRHGEHQRSGDQELARARQGRLYR